jgi:hypothetical protein
MSALSKEYANSLWTSMAIEIKLLERRDLKGRLKRVRIPTVPVQGVKFLTCLTGHKQMGLGALNPIFLTGVRPGGLGDFGV